MSAGFCILTLAPAGPQCMVLFSATDGVRPGGDGLCGTVYRPGCYVADYAH